MALVEEYNNALEKRFLGPNKIKHIMDIKILFIFVGNKCALDYKKEQQFA